tara:strand:- start:693 stop:1430 length:738 start_codon:yes stop_codon:yes gene_type:complete
MKIKNNQILFFFVLVFSLLLLINKVNFFKNFSKVIYFNNDQRLTKTYGYCTDTGVGYLNFLKKNFNFDSNPKIVTQTHIPGLDWVIYNYKKINKNNNEIVILNYPGRVFSKTLKIDQNNSFSYSERVYSVNKIVGLEVIGSFQNIKNPNLSFKIETRVKSFKENKFRLQNNNEKIKINRNMKRNYYKLDIGLIENYYVKGVNLNFLGSKNITQNITGVRIYFENKINLDNFDIIHSHNNCYFLKK